MFSKIYSGAIYGISGRLVTVEADISDGFPSYTLVGYLASEVKEAKERVTTALKNSGYYIPAKKIIVNLSPAGVRKQGTAYDLPIALSLLCSLGYIPQKNLNHIFAIGELSLNGQLCSIKGILPLVLMAKEQGIGTCFVPMENIREAKLVDGVDIIPLPDLKAACIYFCEGIAAYQAYISRWAEVSEKRSMPEDTEDAQKDTMTHRGDFSDIYGQEALKRAIVVAASGMHHLLMIGPPGSGKSMSARRISGIMPDMTFEERMEVTRLYSVSGMLPESCVLMTKRPFRSPHHTVPIRAMTGGGGIPVPGEISLAHRGILYLDEMAEFLPAALDVLRQPLEDGVITINRVHGSFLFPARFMLVGAMNPCKCGYFPDRSRCHCTSQDIYRYMHRVSRPLLDRIDICVDVQPPSNLLLNKKEYDLTSLDMRQMVAKAMSIQQIRFKDDGIHFNSEMTPAMLEKYCVLDKTLNKYMEALCLSFGLSIRGRHKMLKVARTIADLEGSGHICETHLDEAACYRMVDKSYWDF